MTATDELRALLDARGVEWKAPASYDGSTKYDTIVDDYWFHEHNGGITVHGLAPAQAIEATLGREPDNAAMVKLHDQMNAALLEYERAQGIERRDGDGRTVIPFVAEMHRLLEEAALRGHEECRMDKICDGYLYFTSYWCRECDGRFAYRLIGDKHATPKCCPICGSKVVTE